MKKLVVLFCVLIIKLNAQLTPVCFTTACTPGVGANPQALTTGDFNGDGNVDIAVANKGSNNVSILLGMGTGSFATATNFTVGTNLQSICTNDFNNDGKADLALSGGPSSGIGHLTILLGNGSGSFTSVASYTISSNAKHALITGNFNGDGNTDLMLMPGFGVFLYLGLGSGSFSTAISCGATISSPQSLTTADFNNDGKTDFAYGKCCPAGLGAYVGSGSGSFTTSFYNSYSNVLAGPTSLCSGDFNNDGNIDVIASSSSSIISHYGNGTGSFTTAALTASITGGIDGITSSDFNGDGNLDIVGITNNNTIGILLSGFSLFNFLVATNPSAITTADFNGDGKSDIAVTNSGSNNVTILINTTGGVTPTISVISSASLICSGQTATLTASGGANYLWDTGATTNSIVVTGLGALAPTYTVTGTGIDGCAVNASITQSSTPCLGLIGIYKEVNQQINIYPNPANDNINIDISNSLNITENIIINIFNSLGQLIKEEELHFENNKAIINTKDLVNGIYLLTLFDSTNINKLQTVSKRFVVAR